MGSVTFTNEVMMYKIVDIFIFMHLSYNGKGTYSITNGSIFLCIHPFVFSLYIYLLLDTVDNIKHEEGEQSKKHLQVLTIAHNHDNIGCKYM